MQTTYGKYYDTLPDGRVLIVSPMPEGADGTDVRLLWQDQDEITADQRKKIFAICGEIAIWSGHDKELVRKVQTADFLRQNIEQLQLSALSLAITGNCDKGTATLFIDYLINFCLENNVPTARPLQEYADDLERYTYAALLHKRCLVCGKKADLHHVDRIGAGYSRATKYQIGARVMPLCRIHHGEVDTLGQTAFDEKYHVVPVPMDKRIAAKYPNTGKAAS